MLAKTDKMCYIVYAETGEVKADNFGASPCERKSMPLSLSGLSMGRAFFFPLPAVFVAAPTLKNTRETQWRLKTKCVNQAKVCKGQRLKIRPFTQNHGGKPLLGGIPVPGSPMAGNTLDNPGNNNRVHILSHNSLWKSENWSEKE